MKICTLPRAAADLCRCAFTFVILIVFSPFASAQADTGSLGGRVTDTKGDPLSGALVTLKENGREASTSREGEYYFAGLPPGVFTAAVSYLGLPTKEVSVTIAAGVESTLMVKLGEDVLVLEAFQVQGQRSGQARALNEQRASGNLRNIVSSDAAGRFPDQNAAESMQRITGVSLERDQGEGRFISVRGVDPDLNNTQLNGVSIPASQEDSRKVNLDVFPTDILDSIEVVKAVTPDMDGDAIGGSVNIKTQTAFSSDHRILRASVEGGYSDLVDKWGYKYSVTYGDKFQDGKLGFLISYSASKRQFGSNGREADDNPWVAKGGFIVPGGDLQHREYNIIRWRTGLSFSFDYRPDSDNTYYVRGVYSRFSDYENRFRTRFRSTSATATPTSATTGTVSGSRIAVDLKDRYEDNKVNSISAGGEHHRGDWHVDYLAAWSIAKLIDPFRFQPSFRTGNTSWTYDVSNPENPVFAGTGVNLPATSYNFNSWALDKGFNDEDEFTVAANFKRELKIGARDGSVKFGGKYRAKSRTVDVSSDVVTLASGTLTLADFARFSPRGPAATIASINPAAFRAFYAANPSRFGLNANDTAVNAAVGDYASDENILSAYAMGEVAIDRLTLIGGIRTESTDYSTQGWRAVDNSAASLARTSASRDYTTVLPGAVARYAFSKSLIGRASITSTLARPKPLDASSSVLTEDDDVTRGNPNLKPYRSLNFDTSLEFYPKSLGVMSVGFFHKEISDFIYSEVVAGGGVNGGSLTTPLNGDSASVTGVEADWQQQFTGLPAPFDGLGLFANITLIDSESTLGGGRRGEKVPFLNQSKTLYNVALSYEKHGFFARLSLNHRSRYLSLLGGSTAGDQYVQDHSQLDFSTNYKVNSRVTLYAEMLNLTKEPYEARYNLTGGIRKVEFYSWSINAGLKVNF